MSFNLSSKKDQKAIVIRFNSIYNNSYVMYKQEHACKIKHYSQVDWIVCKGDYKEAKEKHCLFKCRYDYLSLTASKYR